MLPANEKKPTLFHIIFSFYERFQTDAEEDLGPL